MHALRLVALLAACAPADAPPDDDDAPRYATEFTVVEVDPGAAAPLQLAVQACAGLSNRRLGGSVYVQTEPQDADWLDALALTPARVVDAATFLTACAADIPACVPYDYASQQELLPAILTAAAATGALPLDVGLDVPCADVTFDAVAELAEADTPLLATQRVADRFLDRTAGLAMLNPGYDTSGADNDHPPITRDMPATLVDLVFSERLFVVFLIHGCVEGEPERDLLSSLVNAGVWPTPVEVYGYNNSWNVGGYLYEAQTRCLASRNMGAIASETYNLSFFSTRRPPITASDALERSAPVTPPYDPTHTYVAFVVGDGDNVRYLMTTRGAWLRQRIAACAEDPAVCAPLTWSLSPHIARLAPDILTWYYATSSQTGRDSFTLPPSGHLYAYPSSLNEADQARFVTATERDASVLGVHGVVHWDWLDTWRDAEDHVLPRYAGGPITGVFPVNVPYLLDPFPWWPADRFYEVLTGDDGGEVVVFRPREWRGVDGAGGAEAPFHKTPQDMAAELGAYPPGTVTWVYMTSDGGLDLENSFLALTRLLPAHVELVTADAASALALEASRR
ncbi:MAG TPA: hypothetical protein PKA64_22465 [Myxococcota bacterium]|nr:hypothetical protein [Myxococcota bacterium]